MDEWTDGRMDALLWVLGETVTEGRANLCRILLPLLDRLIIILIFYLFLVIFPSYSPKILETLSTALGVFLYVTMDLIPEDLSVHIEDLSAPCPCGPFSPTGLCCPMTVPVLKHPVFSHYSPRVELEYPEMRSPSYLITFSPEPHCSSRIFTSTVERG